MFSARLVCPIIVLILSGYSANAESAEDQFCISGICLGDEFSQISSIRWLSYEHWPWGGSIRTDYAERVKDRYSFSKLATDFRTNPDAVSIIQDHIITVDREAVVAISADLSEILVQQITICAPVEVLGMFLTKNGYLGKVLLRPFVNAESGWTELIVTWISREFPPVVRLKRIEMINQLRTRYPAAHLASDVLDEIGEKTPSSSVKLKIREPGTPAKPKTKASPTDSIIIDIASVSERYLDQFYSDALAKFLVEGGDKGDYTSFLIIGIQFESNRQELTGNIEQRTAWELALLRQVACLGDPLPELDLE